MFPDVWSYELFESSIPDNLPRPDSDVYTATDYENYYGRKSYADNTVGGYYAARLSLLEELKKLRSQASCLLLRYVTSEYSVPLGVFVVRQAVRKSLVSEKYEFNTKNEMLDFARNLVLTRLRYDINAQLKSSILLSKFNSQTKLNNFF